MSVRVEIRPSVADLGPDSWARIAAGQSLYLSYPWLAWAEQSAEYRTRYLVALDAAGRVEAALPTYLWLGGTGYSMNRAYDPVDLLVEPRLGPVPEDERAAWRPLLLLGSRAGYHGRIVVDPAVGPSRRSLLIRSLLGAARRLAHDDGAGACALLYAPEPHADECVNAVSQQGDPPCVAPLSAEAVIPVDAQEPSRSRRRQREWEREARVFAASGSKVEVARLSECYEVAGPLLGRLQRKYGEDDTDDAMTAYLADQAARLDACSRVLLERRDGRTTGFALCYASGDTLHVRGAGFAEDSGPYAYFNLAVYEATRLARREGLHHVDLGTGAYRGKLLRGAIPRPTYALVWPPAHTPATWLEALRSPGEDYLAAMAALS